MTTHTKLYEALAEANRCVEQALWEMDTPGGDCGVYKITEASQLLREALEAAQELRAYRQRVDYWQSG